MTEQLEIAALVIERITFIGGTYRTQEIILEIYDALAEASVPASPTEPYRTLLNPPHRQSPEASFGRG